MGDDFAPGVEVIYQGNRGVIKFVDEVYLTICIRTRDTPSKLSNTCLVVYRYSWNEIELVKSNR